MDVIEAFPGTSSSSSESGGTPQPTKCQVCFLQAHGNHFGVDTCRACAAFFRRVYVTHKQHFKCREGDDKCTPDIFGRWNCKKCRTDRCFSLGMRPDNIQLNRDLFINTEKTKKKRKQSVVSMIENITEGSNGTPSRSFFDMTPLFDSVERILMTDNPHFATEFDGLSSLEKLAFGMRELRKEQMWEDVPEIRIIGREESYDHWKTGMIRASTWLTYFDEFQQLDIEDKMTITRGIWLVFARLERSSMTAEMRRINRCKMNEYMMKTNGKLNYDTIRWDFQWLSSFSSEQLKSFIGTTPRIFCESLIQSMMDVQPTDVELCYLVCDLCFYYLGNKLGGSIQKITDRLQEILSDDLHNYYLKNNKSSRYSHRLNTLLKINQQYRTLMEEKRKATFLGNVFNAFQIEWSHPDMFKLGNFEQ